MERSQTNKMMKKIFLAAIAALVLSNMVAFAHHGGSMYDRQETLVLDDAIIVRLLFVNPHARLLFTWTDSDGANAEWEGELSGSNELLRSGIYPDLVQPGDRVTVKGFPHDTVPRNLRLSSIVLPDGREIALP